MEKPISKEREDFSIFLEWGEEESRALDELGERIKNRLKFISTEALALDEMRKDPNADPEKIKEKEKLLSDIYDEMMSLQEEVKEKMEKIRLLIKLHEESTAQLENFEPDIEH